MRKPDPEKAKAQGIAVLAQLFYHDHDPETMAYDPSIAEKTCGKCHENEVKEYNVSSMGQNRYQRGYKKFSDLKPGPQNCGAWFGDNHEAISGELAVEYPKRTTTAQRETATSATQAAATVTIRDIRHQTPATHLKKIPNPFHATETAKAQSAMPAPWTGEEAQAT
ncbi:MAG: hypothetical protein LRY51_04865 [Geovibrio sp.]|nr:hypothetical protein [Geovibrio sp.]